jgi:hypothetical protein
MPWTLSRRLCHAGDEGAESCGRDETDQARSPIIILSGAVDISEQAMKSADAFVAKAHLATELLPTIAQL